MENRCCGVGVEVGHVNHGLLVVEHVVLVGVLESGCGKRPNEEDVKSDVGGLCVVVLFLEEGAII